MTERGKPQAPKTLLEALLDSGGVPLARPVRIDTELSGELAARLRAGAPSLAALDPGDWVRLLAAYLDGSIDAAAKRQLEDQLARSPPELSDLVAARAYLDAMASHRKSEPSELVDAAIAGWLDGDADTLRPADVIAFPPASIESDGNPQVLSQASSRVSSPLPPIELFHLSAAASRTEDQAIRCRSESGRWALELIVGTSAQDEREERGHLRLTVQPDHRATYEGLEARVFVTIGNAERVEERVLAEAAIRDGEINSGFSLRGLDRWTRDVIRVVFTFGHPRR